MGSVKFNDFRLEVESAMDSIADSVLEEVAGELESQIKDNNVVKTGQTKGSWTHHVRSASGMHTATIGSPMENAIWEEFGTGDYALNGDGRKGGWAYEDPDTGETVWTHGKYPRRPAWKAYTTMKNKIIKHIQDKFKGGLV